MIKINEQNPASNRVIIRRITTLFVLFLVLLTVVFLVESLLPASGSNIENTTSLDLESAFLPGREIGILDKNKITEASGMVAGRKTSDILWVHNDSGDEANIYAILPDGEMAGTFQLKKAKSRDWEDIAIGPGPVKDVNYIYLGDIGDNNSEYSSISVYRVEEPNLREDVKVTKEVKIGQAEEIELVYPDGPKDAETLLVDPLTGDIYIITKSPSFAMVYLAAYPQDTEEKTKLEFVTALPLAMATGGDVSSDGRLVIVRSAEIAGLWERPQGEELWKAFGNKPLWINLADEPQGEAICFDAQGRGFYTISEMKHPSIYYFAPNTEE